MASLRERRRVLERAWDSQAPPAKINTDGSARHRGAGDRDRTGMASLEGWGSAIELHPRASAAAGRRHARRGALRLGGSAAGRSVVASAPALGAGDREFESPRPDQLDQPRTHPHRGARTTVKSAVETLSPTRVSSPSRCRSRSSSRASTRRTSGSRAQVTIPGFRKGKVPDAHHRPAVRPRRRPRRGGQRAPAAGVLRQAVARERRQAARPARGRRRPSSTDGGDLKFTAEVDVRPEIELPDYDGIAVDGRRRRGHRRGRRRAARRAARALRARYAGRARRRRSGDFVSIDLSATRDGEADRGRDAERPVLRGRQRASCSTASTRRSSASRPGEPRRSPRHCVAGDVRRQGRRRHRHRQGRHGAGAARGRRRLRPARERVRHPRRAAQATCAQRLGRDQAARAGRRGPRQGPRPACWRSSTSRCPESLVEAAGRRPTSRTGTATRRTAPRSRPRRREQLKSQFVLDEIARKEELAVAEDELTE